jgi:hypothetical protein
MILKTGFASLILFLLLASAGLGQKPLSMEVPADADEVTSIAVAGPERFVLALHEIEYSSAPPNVDVFAQIYQGVGKAEGPPFRVSFESIYPQERGNVDTDAHGNFVVIWSSAPGGKFAARIFDRSGAPKSRTIAVNRTRICNYGSEDVAMSPTGDFLVVWEGCEGNDDNPRILAARFSASGRRRGGEVDLGADNRLYKRYPSVASRPNGFVATWTEYREPCRRNYDGKPAAVIAHFDEAGRSTGPAFRVRDYYDPCQGSGWMAGAPFTGAVGTLALLFGERVAFQLFTPDGQVAGPLRAPSSSQPCTETLCETFAGFAMNENGRLVILWERSSLEGRERRYDLFAQAFDLQGQPAGPRFQVNELSSTSDSMSPRMVLTDEGTLLVSWIRQRVPGVFTSEAFLRWFHIE